jgi:hypothetical protein
MFCLWCKDPVTAGEEYEERPMVGSEGPRTGYIHFECAARMSLGSLGHLRGNCSCYGGKEDDPVGISRRQAARAALRYLQGLDPFPP